MDIFGLEDNLPDELVSSGNSWGEQLGGNKPPAQGPGPGMPLNGEDPNIPNVQLQRQIQHQQLQHMMQQVIYNFYSVRFNYFLLFFKLALNEELPLSFFFSAMKMFSPTSNCDIFLI